MANSIKASPFRWVWDQTKRLYRRFRGEKLEKIKRPSSIQRDRFIAQNARDGFSADLAGRVVSGDITIQQWTLDFRAQLKDVFRNEYFWGRGGDAAMTFRDWGILGSELKPQYGYMQRFAEAIARGELSEAQIRNRMEMYFKAATQGYERGRSEMLGMPRLPAYPGDGQTICRSNCQCHWDTEETENEWLATWTLGAAEHCLDCLGNADKWAPLRLPK